MREAMLPLGATAFLAFFVYRWAGDELDRDGRLTPGAANAVVVVFLLHAMIVALASAGRVGPVGLPPSLALALGVPLAIAGFGLVIAGARALGSRDRLVGIADDRLVTTGIYRVMRHPFAAGWTLALVGVALAGRSSLALVLAAAMAIVLVLLSRFEDKLMRRRFGVEAEQYQLLTPHLPRPRALRRAGA